MTTTVKVLAHCAPEKEVRINYVDNNGLQEKIIQDGQTWEGVVYDSKTITVQEVLKTE